MTTVIPFPTAPEPAIWGEAQPELTPEQVASAEAAADVGLRWRQEIERPAILPIWLAHPLTEGRAAAGWHLGHAWYLTRLHGLRLPKYYGRVALRSPAGAKLYARSLWAVLSDAEGLAERRALAEAVSTQGTASAALAKRAETHSRNVLVRCLFGAMLAVLAVWASLAAAGWLYRAGGRPALAGALAALVGALGWHGRPPGKRLTDWAVDRDEGPPKLTSELIVQALDSLGIAKLSAAIKADGAKAVQFRTPVHRQGHGWRVDLDLPAVPASEVIDRRERLAAALRRPIGCVWPEPDEDESEARLVLYVSDKRLAAMNLAPWPLLERGSVDLFEPAPIGHNQRGELVTLTLAYASFLIGAIPRMGKTFLLRLLGLVAVLDRRTQLYAYDLKGTGDLDCFEPVAHRLRVGDDPADIEGALEDLRALRVELRRRTKAVRAMPKELAPESKVTSELADRRSLGLWPIVVLVDECQVWFESAWGPEFEEIMTDLVKRGPALAIIPLAATQRPDAQSVPTGIRDNVAVRLCLKVMTQVANDMILGTGMYKAGYSAVTFTRKDKGQAWLVGEGGEPAIVKASYVDAVQASAVVARAVSQRLAAGWELTGHAAGADMPADPDIDDSVTVLEDARDIWPADAKALSFQTLALFLSEAKASYVGWQATQVSAALAPHGLQGVNVRDRWAGGKPLKGVKHDDLLRALARAQAEAAGDA